jgi:hypothetical protein
VRAIRKTVIVALLLSAAATLAMWPCSYWKMIIWRSRHPSQLPFVAVCFIDGKCRIDYLWQLDQVSSDHVKWATFAGFSALVFRRQRMSHIDEPAGFTIRREKSIFDEDGRVRPHWRDVDMLVLNDVGEVALHVPLWFPFALFLLYPGLACLKGPLRRRRRKRRGQCVSCGYNLTGNLAGVCPECGNESNTSSRSIEPCDGN